MYSAIVTLIAIVCAVKWLCLWVGNAALILYMLKKEYTLPSDEEIEACLTEAWRHTLRIK